MNDLQLRITEWHKARFPDAEVAHVALKLGEETGEVQSGVNALVGKNSATGDGDLVGEAADVVICAFVLLGRWGGGEELLEAVEQKLAILTNPNSGHRAALA